MAENPFSVEFKGFDAVMRAIDDAAAAPKGELVEVALAQAGATIIQTAKGIVPVDSGDLRDNLHVGGYTHLTPGWRRVGVYGAYKRLKHPPGKPRAVILGSKLPYAHLVERGSRRNAARPFLRPAIDRHKNDIAKTVDAAIDKKIHK